MRQRPQHKPQHQQRSQQRPQQNRQEPKANYRTAAGLHAVNEALKVRPKTIRKLVLKKGWESSEDLQEVAKEARRLRVVIEERGGEVLDKLTSGHQGVAAEITESPEWDLNVLKEKESALVIFLDGLEDPHNLGAILRTAWLMGVDGIVIPEHRAAGLTATAHKVACGGAEHVPVLIKDKFSDVLSDLKEIGFWTYGFAAGSKNSLYKIKYPNKVALVIGAEDRGLRTTTEKSCDELVFIPQSDSQASYNASVAAAISIAEVIRQRG